MRRRGSGWVLCLGILLSASHAVYGWAQTAAGEAAGQRVRVYVGKSVVLNSPEPLKRVSVGNPEVASAMVITERQVLINGLLPGSTSLLLWNEAEQVQPFDLEVQIDVPALQATLGQSLPGSRIDVRQSGASVVLTGEVGSEVESAQAEALAKTFASGVVTLLAVRENRDVVLLQVRIAEVNRAALSELGINLFSTGAGNTPGTVTTGQFGGVTAGAGSRPEDVAGASAGGSGVGGAMGNTLAGTPTVIGLSDLMNIFLFRSDANLGATIRALEQRNLLQVLAEPNVLALNGREASFLAGGEFPFPVVQGGASFNTVTIQFREFGIRVNFTPQVLEDEVIRLKVAPEVSALDFANALTLQGFVIPALSTRKASTEVELKDGQSFAIAGLMDNRLVEVASKIPGLGDIPFIGKLFRSRSLNRTNTELLVVVTPRLVGPMDSGQVPEVPFPKGFLDAEEFDRPARGEAEDGR